MAVTIKEKRLRHECYGKSSSSNHLGRRAGHGIARRSACHIAGAASDPPQDQFGVGNAVLDIGADTGYGTGRNPTVVHRKGQTRVISHGLILTFSGGASTSIVIPLQGGD